MRRAAAVLCAALLGLAGLTALVAAAFDGAHDGKVAGNEAMLISAAWGTYGLAMGLAARKKGLPALQSGAYFVLTLALLYLVLGGLMGNARWAEPWARYTGYVGVLGSVWTAELLLRSGETGGLLAVTAAVTGFGACAFEVVRWLEPVFTLPLGQPLTPELYAFQESTRAFWTVGVWGLYALLVMGAGVLLRSAAARRLAAGLFGVALTYAAVAALGLAS